MNVVDFYTVPGLFLARSKTKDDETKAKGVVRWKKKWEVFLNFPTGSCYFCAGGFCCHLILPTNSSLGRFRHPAKKGGRYDVTPTPPAG